MSIKSGWGNNWPQVTLTTLTVVWVAGVAALLLHDDHRARQKTIDVIEACEELPKSPERIAEEDTTHA